jgi:hypothetical protein
VIHVEIQVLGHESPYSMTELGSFLVSRAVKSRNIANLRFPEKKSFRAGLSYNDYLIICEIFKVFAGKYLERHLLHIPCFMETLHTQYVRQFISRCFLAMCHI